MAVDAQGDPALIVAPRGTGRAVVCSHPVELLLAGRPDAHGPDDRSWGLYAGLAACAGVAEPAAADHPDVTSGSLAGPAGGLVTLTNHAEPGATWACGCPRTRRGRAWWRPTGAGRSRSRAAASAVALDGYAATIVAWDRPA